MEIKNRFFIRREKLQIPEQTPKQTPDNIIKNRFFIRREKLQILKQAIKQLLDNIIEKLFYIIMNINMQSYCNIYNAYKIVSEDKILLNIYETLCKEDKFIELLENSSIIIIKKQNYSKMEFINHLYKYNSLKIINNLINDKTKNNEQEIFKIAKENDFTEIVEIFKQIFEHKGQIRNITAKATRINQTKSLINYK